MLEYYAIFCLATTIVAFLVVMYPAIAEANALNEENMDTLTFVLTLVITFLAFLVIAPVIFIAICSNSKTELFKEGVVKAFLT